MRHVHSMAGEIGVGLVRRQRSLAHKCWQAFLNAVVRNTWNKRGVHASVILRVRECVHGASGLNCCAAHKAHGRSCAHWIRVETGVNSKSTGGLAATATQRDRNAIINHAWNWKRRGLHAAAACVHRDHAALA